MFMSFVAGMRQETIDRLHIGTGPDRLLDLDLETRYFSIFQIVTQGIFQHFWYWLRFELI